MYALSAPVPKLDADSAALPVGIKVFFVIVFTFTTDRMGRRTIVIVLAGRHLLRHATRHWYLGACHPQ